MLNQRLYDLIVERLGEVQVINRGIPIEASYDTDPATGKQRLHITQYGESYLIQCPYCNQGNLSIPHGFGEIDPVSSWPRVFLAKCFGKNCLKEKGRPTELYRKLYGYVNQRRDN